MIVVALDNFVAYTLFATVVVTRRISLVVNVAVDNCLTARAMVFAFVTVLLEWFVTTFVSIAAVVGPPLGVMNESPTVIVLLVSKLDCFFAIEVAVVFAAKVVFRVAYCIISGAVSSTVGAVLAVIVPILSMEIAVALLPLLVVFTNANVIVVNFAVA